MRSTLRNPAALLCVAFWTVVLVFAGTGCFGPSDADQAGENVSKAAEQFEVGRRIIFFNGITDNYLFQVEGYCSVETAESGLAGALSVICLAGEDEDGDRLYVKHFLGLSDNVSYIVEQLEGIHVSATHPRIIFKPESIVPDFDRP